mgnify:CR=1 FL=1
MKRLLIVVDYQKDFVDGALGFAKAKTLERGIADRIRTYKANGDRVVFTFDTHDENYLSTLEGKYLPIKHCLKDTPGWQLYGQVQGELTADTPVFLKHTFGSLELALYLQDEEFDQIEFVGLVTNMCVLSNAVLAKAACPNAVISVNASLCASFDESLHLKTLDVLKGIHLEII